MLTFQDEMIHCRQSHGSADIRKVDNKVVRISCPSCRAFIVGQQATTMYAKLIGYFDTYIRNEDILLNAHKSRMRGKPVHYRITETPQPSGPFIINLIEFAHK